MSVVRKLEKLDLHKKKPITVGGIGPNISLVRKLEKNCHNRKYKEKYA